MMCKKNVVIVILLLACSLLFASTGFQVDYSSKSASEIQLNFELDDYSIDGVVKDGVNYSKIKFVGSVVTNDKGFAELPFINANIQISTDKNVDLEIIGYDYKEYTLDFPLLPSRGTIYRNQNPDEIPYEISPKSIVDSWYPGELAYTTEPFILRDVRGTNVRVQPFQYNAVTKMLRVYESVKVVVKDNNEKSTNPMSVQNPTVSPEMVDLYNTVFINFNDNQRYANQIGQNGELLVIYTSRDATVIQPYITWKREKGFIVHTQQVSTGTNVKTNILNAYNSNNNILYVQLVGDWADIKSDLGTSQNLPMDPKMGCVAGSDNYPDIIIGRFSASATTHVTTQVNKTINYEKNPDVGGTWYKNALGMARNEGAGSGDDSEGDDLHMERIRDYRLLPYNFSTVYQEYDGGSSYVGSNTTSTIVSNRINSGVSMLNYINHGSETGWSVASYSNSHVNSLTNGNKLPFIWSVACLVGKFNYTSGDCFAETWLKKENGGAVAFLGSTISQPWTPPMRGQDYFNDILIGGYNYSSDPGNGTTTTASDKRTTFGSIAFNGMVLMYSESSGTDDLETIQTWTIFGDASLQVRTDTPKTVSLSNSAVMVGTAFTTTVTTGGTAVEGALVSLYQNGNTYSGYTNSSGSVTINHSLTAGAAKLVVTGYNLLTKYDDITVTSSSGPYVVIDGYTISAGGNSTIEYGETVYLSVTLRNSGTSTASSTNMTISESDAYATLNDSSESFGNIAAGASVTRTSAFQWTMANSVPDEHAFTINSTISCTGDSWTPSMNFTANAPVLAFGTVTINDSSGGNGNGKLDPGETVTITVPLQNTGHAASASGSATMSCGASGITVTNGNDTFSAIATSGSDNLSFTLSVDSGIAVGSEITLNFNATAGSYTTSASADFEVGLIIIGSGTVTGQYLPIEPYYGYTYSQSIYLQSEINVSNSEITKISYYYAGSTAWTDAIAVYMGHTTKAAFSSTSDWVPLSSLTQVYSGNLTVTTTNGWVDITLSTPFAYNNVNNLVIAVDENTSGYHDTADDFYCSTVSGNRSIYYYSDTTNPNPSTPPTAMGTPAAIPNLKLVFQSGSSNPADIAVNPTSISNTLAPDATATSNLTISNTGDATLTYTAEVQYTAKSRFEERAYCIASGGGDEFISNVQVGSINNTSTAGSYVNYTSQSTDMEIGTGYSITVTNGNPYTSDQCGIWIDWNQDEDFDDAGETIVISNTPGGGPYTATITPPTGAVSGSTRMRVRIMYTGTLSSCGTTTYGEVEDYTINVIGGSSEESWLTVDSGSSTSGSVAAGGNDVITVGFDATDLLEDTYSANIIVTSNDPDESSINIPVTLTVSGGGEPEFVLNPTSLSFGNVTINNTSTLTFTISNTGTELLSGNISTPYTQYVVTANSKNNRSDIIYKEKSVLSSIRNTISYNIPVGGSTTFTLAFTPTSVTSYNGNVVITSNDADEASNNLAVTGAGIAAPAPEISITPLSLTYGNVTVNTTSNKTFTISNTGNATLTGNISTPFTQYNVALQRMESDIVSKNEQTERNTISYTINAGGSQTFNLAFTPNSVTSYNGNVVITSNDADESSNNLAVTGAGIAAPVADINVTPATIAKTMETNQTGTENLQIANTGNASLTYSASVSYNSKSRATILSEGFENGGSIPSGWTQAIVSGTVNWTFVSGNGSSNPNAAHTGTYNALLKDSDSADDKTRLITPSINFGTNTVNPQLIFWHYMQLWSPDQDELNVYYKTSAGDSWILLQSYTANVSSWTQRTLTLPNPSSDYYLAFEGNAKYGYGVCVDDVIISGDPETTTPDWLALNGQPSVSGTITAGNNNSVTVNFDTDGLAEDTYDATIVITSNDPDENPVNVDVTLTVSAVSVEPAITVSVSQLTSEVTIGETDSKNFTITNNGDSGSDLTYSISWQYGRFGNVVTSSKKDIPEHIWERLYATGDRDNTWLTVTPTTGNCLYNQTDQITVGFDSNGMSAGTYTATISIANNATVDQTVNVTFNVVGNGLPVNPNAIAEFAPAEGVLIRYPFGISYSLIAELSQEINVTTIVASTSEQNTVTNNYNSNGVNMTNCDFIIAASDSYWTRDSGPFFIRESNQNISIVDFDYNRPRPNDNVLPQTVANHLGLNYYYMPVTHTGGNYMTNGMGTAASTTIVYSENTSLSNAQVDSYMNTYMGITNHMVVDDPNNTYIDHIDCWGKFLAPNKVMIRSVHTGHAQYSEIEETASYFASQISAYGTPYEVYRVYTSNDEPYTNSLIINNRVFVPQMGTGNDGAAIASYQSAMPGYEILGFTGSWESTDALHCRVKEISDTEMLYVEHVPMHGEYAVGSYNVNATVIPYSGTTITSGYPRVYYRVDSGSWNYVTMSSVGNDEYQGTIPQQTAGSEIDYYIVAQDGSGRTENHPYIGAADAHSFSVEGQAQPAELVVNVSSVVKNMTVDETGSEIIQLSNSGEGTINYTLSLSENRGSIDRNLTGSTVVNNTTEFTHGETTIWTFTVTCSSDDNEWVKDLWVDFPTGVTVNSSTALVGGSGGDIPTDGTTGDGITLHWGGAGYMANGQAATTEVEVTISSGFIGEIVLPWTLHGDEWGNAPHEVNGTMTLTPLSNPLSWVSLGSNSGTINAFETHNITLNFDSNGLAVGDYNCYLHINDDRELTVIPVTLSVIDAPNYPTWEPVTYANDPVMLYASITVNNTPAVAGDIVGAFVGEECRGTATVQVNGRASFVVMEIEMAQTNEVISFKVYANSSDAIYNADYSTTADPGETIGDSENMVPINAITNTSAPDFVGRMIEDGYVILYWEPIQEAITYRVYSSDNPFIGFTLDNTGALDLTERGITWSAPLNSASKRFYYVTVIY